MGTLELTHRAKIHEVAERVELAAKARDRVESPRDVPVESVKDGRDAEPEERGGELAARGFAY